MIKCVKTIFCVKTGYHVYKRAPGSFIFSLQNKENFPPFKAPLKNRNSIWAIYANSGYGPAFGIHDLYISDNAASNINSYTRFGYIFQPPSGIGDSSTILAATQNFTPLEVEVFYLSGEN